MSIGVMLHPYLSGDAEVHTEVNGNTVGECLKEIVKEYPGMEKKLFDKQGKLKGYVEVLVNGESAGDDELGHAVKDGDSMSVLVFLSGG